MRLRSSRASACRFRQGRLASAAEFRAARKRRRRAICSVSISGSTDRIGGAISFCSRNALTPTDPPLALLELALRRVGRVLDLPLEKSLLDRGDRAAQLVDLCGSGRGRGPGSRPSRPRRDASRPADPTTSATPVSLAMTCCVRRARRADCSVGRARASSDALVWRDCVPPITAESACSATRTTLTSGCCAVSVDPAVCVWKRRRQERGSFAPNRSRAISAQSERAARNFATSSKKFAVRVEEERQPRSEVVDREPAAESRLDVGDRVREREGDLLDRRRSGLADVVAGDRDRVPAGHLRRRRTRRCRW